MTTVELSARLREYPKKRVILAAAALLIAIALREHLLDAVVFAALSLWRMAPIVLLGVLVTALLTATGSIGLLVSTFNGRELAAVVLVSLIGTVLPVCGITVLPLVAGLLSAGVPLAPVMAFLLSSAVTSPEMFAITAGILGVPFALGKTLAALGIGLAGGAATFVLVRLGRFTDPVRKSSSLLSLLPASPCGGTTALEWRFWRDAERLNSFKQSALGLSKLVLLWLGAAFMAEFFLKLYLPEDALVGLVGADNPLAVPIAATIGAPLYLDGYAALPFVRSLIEHGMAQGAALAFLVAGGITSAWTAIPVLALFRLPVFTAYILMAVTGSMLAGWIYAWVIA